MAKLHQGIFTPVNPQKVVGNAKIFYRSGWERNVMMLLDQHPDVINWASESIQIPYQNPLTGRWTVYIPDFMVISRGKSGIQKAEIIEVKPKREALAENARSKKDRAALLLNTAKWAACIGWCKKHGFTFRILTEDQLFPKKGKDIKK